MISMLIFFTVVGGIFNIACGALVAWFVAPFSLSDLIRIREKALREIRK